MVLNAQLVLQEVQGWLEGGGAHVVWVEFLVIPVIILFALLLLYIVLGSFALKRARTARAKLLFFLASLLCFAFMLTVARAHNALGFLSQFMTQ